jgi:acyl-CoA synthetase (NDP forming)
MVQQQIVGGHEMIIGTTRDPVLGPAVMVGLGGIFAEVFADASVRPVPISRDDISAMLSELHGAAILSGVRGQPGVDIEAIVDLVRRVSTLAEDRSDALIELDLNPVIVSATGAVVADALAVVDPSVW